MYNLGLDEFFAWYGQEPRPGFTKATVSAWRVALEARGLGAVSINVRITAVRKLAVEAADNGLLEPELANGIIRVKGVASKGVRIGNWLTAKQAQALLNAPDATTIKGLRDRGILAVLLGCGLRRSEVAALSFKHIQQRDGRWCMWTWSASMGGSAIEASKIAGHSDLEMTGEYTFVTPERQNELTRRIQEKIADAGRKPDGSSEAALVSPEPPTLANTPSATPLVQ